MARIALRAYIREITDQIDNHQIEEAISHCRHILEQYPKHVDTYRLLGKAYLEEQRYSDAADILQRVLSSIPDDFISHIGMSIIREDEGNIDAAIYHMELAFETQPSNHAIQSELRRLHGIRDGIETARIRLTRGALSRMYAHGHLYDQAIAELQAAISEDSQRLDLLTLLAEMYFQADKKVDAAETCTKILEKLPYCLSANQLLAKILSDNGRTAEADRYKMRWESLDPYAQFVDEGYTTIDDVPEESITVERQEWEPEAYYSNEGGQPDWASSLGMTIEEEPESEGGIPTWLAAGEEEESAKEKPTDEVSDTELDFSALSESTEEDWPEPDEEEDELGLFETESKTPQGEEDFFASLKEDAIEEEPLPDFLGEIGKPEDTEEVDWLASLGESEEGAGSPQEAETEDADDWFASLAASAEDSAPTLDEEDGEDWFASLESAESDTAPSAVSQSPDEEEGEEIDWLASLDETTEQAAPSLEPLEEGDDDWLSVLESAEGDTTPSAVSQAPAEEEGEEEDWLASLGDTAEHAAPSLEPLEEGDDDWLSSLESAEGDTAPSAVSQPSAEEEGEEDDWLASLGETTEEEAPTLEPLEEGDDDWLSALESAESDTAPSAVGETTAEEEEEDDWLSALGEPEEKQASEASDEAEAEIPEFLREAGWEERTGDEEDFKPVEYVEEEEESAEIEQGELPPWLQSMAPSEPEPKPSTSDLMADLDPEWVAEADSQTLETPDWLTELGEEEQAQESVPEPTDETSSQGVEIEADEMDMAWLESLAAKQGIPDEELVTTPEQRSQVEEGHVPESISEEEGEDEDDWLAGLAAEEPESEEAEEEDEDWLASLSAPEEETPDQSETVSFALDEKIEKDDDDLDTGWLNEIGQEAAEEAAATSMEPLAEEDEEEDDWLAGLAAEQPESETEDDDWMAGLGTPEEKTPDQSETVSFALDEEIEEDDDDLDTGWLNEIGQEAAQEAAATSIEPPTEEDEEEDDWLAGLAAEQPEAEEEDDDEDDLDTGWLNEIGQEAAEEAAATSIEPLSEEDEEEDDWLAGLAAEQPESETEDDDWLAELGTPVEGTPGQDETLSLSLDDEEDEEEDDWLAGLGQESAEVEEGDEDWLTELGTPEKETPDQSETVSFALDDEEKEEDNWLAGLAEDEEESTEAAPESAVLEEEDDFDMDWLDEIGQEAAEEAAATSLESAGEAPEEPAQPDWLTGLADEGEEETTEAAPESAVLEEEDDFDMDWLDEIGQEAAEEAAATSLEPAGEEPEEPIQPDWLAGLAEDEEESMEVAPESAVLEEEDDFDMDWLDEIGQEAAEEAAATSLEPTGEEPEEPTQPDWLTGLADEGEEEETTEVAPESAVLEEEDDFNMDWLDEIGQEAAEEAAATSLEPAGEEPEEPTEPDWLAGLTADQTEAEEEEDWLADLSETSAEAQEEEPQTALTQDEPLETEEESDFLNTDWLHQIGQEAAQEAAETSIEPPAESVDEVEDSVEEDPPPWLASIEQETVSDQILSSEDTIGRFISDLETDQPDETEEEAPALFEEEDNFDMDWLEEISQVETESEAESPIEEESLEEETPEPAEESPVAEEQIPSLDIEDTGVWLASLGVEELEAEEEESAEDIPAWLKEPQDEEEPTVTPTQADEWIPEFQEEPEDAAPPASEPESAAEPAVEPPVQLNPNSPEGILENARTLIQEGHLDAGIAGYNKLIKKGKMVGTVIEDIQAAIQRHPVESNLWQTLGDAYLRMDNLQEALDAYTKAEDLLR